MGGGGGGVSRKNMSSAKATHVFIFSAKISMYSPYTDLVIIHDQKHGNVISCNNPRPKTWLYYSFLFLFFFFFFFFLVLCSPHRLESPNRVHSGETEKECIIIARLTMNVYTTLLRLLNFRRQISVYICRLLWYFCPKFRRS